MLAIAPTIGLMKGGALVILMKGPLVATGNGARKTCAAKLGFSPVLSVTSVPSDLKFSCDVYITDAGCKAEL